MENKRRLQACALSLVGVIFLLDFFFHDELFDLQLKIRLDDRNSKNKSGNSSNSPWYPNEHTFNFYLWNETANGTAFPGEGQWNEKLHGLFPREVSIDGLTSEGDQEEGGVPVIIAPSTVLNITIDGAQLKVNPPYIVLYGPSLFSVDNITECERPGHFRVTFPDQMDPGAYTMHVLYYHKVDRVGKKYVPLALPGSPFRVRVVEEEKSSKPPPCISSYSSSQVPGRWIRASPSEMLLGQAPRNGWLWAPFSCRYEMFPIWNLPDAAVKPLWIVVMGTSTNRGLFFQMLDLILPESQVQQIGLTEIWKCWGYLDFRVGNFRISYRDQRFHYPDSMLSDGYRELSIGWLHQNICPGHSNEGDEFHLWADTRADGFSATPDVVVAESPDIVKEQSNGCIEEYEAGGGIFIGTSHKPRTSTLNSGEVGQAASAAYEQAGLPFIDFHPMARPLYNSGRADFYGRDIHYVHTGHCSPGTAGTTVEHVCSSVMEMEVFMVMDTVRNLLPPGRFVTAATTQSGSKEYYSYQNREPKKFTICHQCPKNFGFFDPSNISCKSD